MWIEGRRSRRTAQPYQPQPQQHKKNDPEKKLRAGKLPSWFDFVLFLRWQKFVHKPKYSCYHHLLLTGTTHNFCIVTWTFQRA